MIQYGVHRQAAGACCCALVIDGQSIAVALAQVEAIFAAIADLGGCDMRHCVCIHGIWRLGDGWEPFISAIVEIVDIDVENAARARGIALSLWHSKIEGDAL
jgi:hypothetical protein